MLGRQKRGQDQDLARAAGWTIPCRDRSPEAERSGVFTRTRQSIRLPEAWRLRQLVEVVKRNFRETVGRVRQSLAVGREREKSIPPPELVPALLRHTE
jgi:hypothetical protein